MKHRQKKLSSSRGLGVSKISPNASIDDRLTHAQMMMSMAFKHGIDLPRRIISLTGEIDGEMFNKLDRAMTEMENESRGTITLKINSPGGHCYQAMALVGRIRESKCKIVTKGYGEVMSAATLLLASGDERLISKHSAFMYHEPSYEVGWNRHSTHKDFVQQSDRENSQWAKLMAEFTNKSTKFWLNVGDRKDAYFTAEQLLEMGVVDELF